MTVSSGAFASAQAAIETAEEELQALNRRAPERKKQTARIIRLLPKPAETLQEPVRAGNAGLRDPRSILEGRNVLSGMFGAKVPLHPGTAKSASDHFWSPAWV